MTERTNFISFSEPSNQDKLLSDLRDMMSKFNKGVKPKTSQSLNYQKKVVEQFPFSFNHIIFN